MKKKKERTRTAVVEEGRWDAESPSMIIGIRPSRRGAELGCCCLQRDGRLFAIAAEYIYILVKTQRSERVW
jgi:hypothetical protein